MKKSILLSVKPKWVKKILDGSKTIEVRRNFPKCEVETAYIYRSNSHKDNGNKIVGSFTPKARQIETGYIPYCIAQTCLTEEEYYEYVGKRKTVWLIEITNFVAYDNPKDLSDLRVGKAPQNFCYVD